MVRLRSVAPASPLPRLRFHGCVFTAAHSRLRSHGCVATAVPSRVAPRRTPCRRAPADAAPGAAAHRCSWRRRRALRRRPPPPSRSVDHSQRSASTLRINAPHQRSASTLRISRVPCPCAHRCARRGRGGAVASPGRWPHSPARVGAGGGRHPEHPARDGVADQRHGRRLTGDVRPTATDDRLTGAARSALDEGARREGRPERSERSEPATAPSHSQVCLPEGTCVINSLCQLLLRFRSSQQY